MTLAQRKAGGDLFTPDTRQAARQRVVERASGRSLSRARCTAAQSAVSEMLRMIGSEALMR
jgi:hypothetical protein